MQAEAAKPCVTASQHLLATYYMLAGRSPPSGVMLPDPSVAAPAIEKARAAAAAAAAAAAVTGSGSDLARRVAGAKQARKPPQGFGSGAAAGAGVRGSMTPVCGIVVGPFRGADMRRPEDFAHYHAQPQRVVPLTAQLLAACGYLVKKDALEAAAQVLK